MVRSHDPAFALASSSVPDAARSGLAGQHEAARRGDAKALKEAALSLKGTSASMSATVLASVCAAVESAAARGEIAGPEALDPGSRWSWSEPAVAC